MDFSELKQKLLLVRDKLQGKIVIIDEIVKGLDSLHGIEDVAIPTPTKMGGKGRPRSTKSKNGLLKGNDLDYKPNGKQMLLLSDSQIKAAKKKEYMAKWRAKKNAQKSTPGFTGSISKQQDSGLKPNKFSLEREFELDDKDLSLMLSYLSTWKGTGRLELSEVRVLGNYEGRANAGLATSERNDIRNVFYGCRNRVMQKTIKHSKEA